MLTLVLVAALGVVGAPKVATRIPVFVRTVATADGFTDPSKDRVDSAKDLAKKVRDSRVLAIVESEQEAIVVLEIVGRGTRREVNAMTFFSGAAQNRSELTVRLFAGDYGTEFTATGKSSGMFTAYGDAAKKLTKQIEEWVAANYERLTAGNHP